MKKLFFLLIIIIGNSTMTTAQCDDCPSVTNAEIDFCYTNKLMPKLCLQISNKAAKAYLSRKNKNIELPLKDTRDLAYFISLSEEKSLKLTANEMIFIMEAFKSLEQQAYDKAIEAGKDIALDKEDYFTLQSGLGIKYLNKGSGEEPQSGQTVSVHYRGVLEDGTEFDNSFKRGKPITFKLGVGQVIKGWDEGIANMKKGSAAWLKIPADLGYGSRARGPIPANATLYFYVVLVDVN